MSELLVKPKQTPEADGSVIKVSPEDAGWGYVGFEVYQLQEGQSFTKETGDREIAVVLLSGKADASTNSSSWDNIGKRTSVFDDSPAYTVYVSSNDQINLKALTDLEIAVCSAPGKELMKLG